MLLRTASFSQEAWFHSAPGEASVCPYAAVRRAAADRVCARHASERAGAPSLLGGAAETAPFLDGVSTPGAAR
jgi:hypothetical protein